MGNLYYCPYCGEIMERSDYKRNKRCWCNCAPWPGGKLIKSDLQYEDYKIHYSQYVIEPIHYHHSPSVQMYEDIWQQYVDIPSNHLLNRNAFEKTKKRVYNGGVPIKENVKSYLNKKQGIVSCPKCGSQSISTVKQGFGVGKAVAGVIAAGPEGALAGAVGANKVLNVCQNCGHQWEPGK